jgi:hypothetical protein
MLVATLVFFLVASAYELRATLFAMLASGAN